MSPPVSPLSHSLFRSIHIYLYFCISLGDEGSAYDTSEHKLSDIVWNNRYISWRGNTNCVAAMPVSDPLL
ncbi:hypothetical protein HanRHA438_Chr17g0803461 [Helianthus annuus]|uniref:Uncharacterized protein n=1 Tax=Helianthus annuus TaxID=4232 RepID=A0A9K3DFL4_HELAN|nr:hypothetical protein HanXRQr2_Chr17g0793261 [Helianthus annuus]KAJ0432569.1 hypothetical protein HanIR_Chr17g0860681 [Helianthus annuus]KAJ0631707.1 hypothetical protein HanLR1_Chr17g0656981 [Helianthus annuus]KAJ0635618.1 hypothetical protein HanOQP8_Chr17g0652891 [Helianthus annuus]KAJ0812366.1 hypothetical protein HanPSC8_Chr17g0761251 [Helianthus annuus]